jgi:hypothetical protein
LPLLASYSEHQDLSGFRRLALAAARRAPRGRVDTHPEKRILLTARRPSSPSRPRRQFLCRRQTSGRITADCIVIYPLSLRAQIDKPPRVPAAELVTHQTPSTAKNLLMPRSTGARSVPPALSGSVLLLCMLCTAKFDDMIDIPACNHGYAASACRCFALQVPLKIGTKFSSYGRSSKGGMRFG